MEPAVLICSGSWHVPDHYSLLATSLQNQGIKTVRCPRLPSAFEDFPLPENANLAGDTVIIQAELDSLAEAGHPIIILCHSYGGALGSNSLTREYLWTERQKAGRPGGVVHITYMAAFIIPAGTSLEGSFGGHIPEYLHPNRETGELGISDMRMAFYSDVEDEDEARKWVAKCLKCSMGCWDKIEHTPYEWVGKGLDATYLVCTKDYLFPVEAQEGMATLLGDTRRMEHLDAGHCPMVSRPDDVAGTVKRAWEFSEARISKAARL